MPDKCVQCVMTFLGFYKEIVKKPLKQPGRKPRQKCFCRGCAKSLKFKYCHSIRRQRIVQIIFLTVARAFLRLIDLWLFPSVAAKLRRISVQHQFIFLFLRNAHPVIGPFHRSKIDHKQQTLSFCLTVPDKTENASKAVIRVDPLKTFPTVVQFIQATSPGEPWPGRPAGSCPHCGRNPSR